jgi:hypothetical protein
VQLLTLALSPLSSPRRRAPRSARRSEGNPRRGSRGGARASCRQQSVLAFQREGLSSGKKCLDHRATVAECWNSRRRVTAPSPEWTV